MLHHLSGGGLSGKRRSIAFDAATFPLEYDFLQSFSSVVKSRHDGSNRRVEQLGHVPVGETAEVLQNDDLAMLERQPVDGPPDQADSFLFLETLQRRESRRRKTLSLVVTVIERLGLFSDPLDKIETVVLQDSVEPGIERPLGIESFSRLEGFDEGVLRQVAGIFRIAR